MNSQQSMRFFDVSKARVPLRSRGKTIGKTDFANGCTRHQVTVSFRKCIFGVVKNVDVAAKSIKSVTTTLFAKWSCSLIYAETLLTFPGSQKRFRLRFLSEVAVVSPPQFVFATVNPRLRSKKFRRRSKCMRAYTLALFSAKSGGSDER